MRNKTIAICCHKNDIYWILDYKYSHRNEDLIILALDIESQLELKSRGLSYLQIFEVEHFDHNNIGYIKKGNIFKLAKDIFKIIEKETSTIKINNCNISSLLVNNLNLAYIDILHYFKTYQNIIKKWNPRKILIPKHSSTINPFVRYLKYYASNSTIKILYYQASFNTYEIFTYFIKKIKQKYLLIISLPLKIYYRIKLDQLNSINKKVSRITIIMQTGGIISSYYYQLYTLLSKFSRFKLITYKLRLNQYTSLVNNRISFTQLNNYWNDKLNIKYENYLSDMKKKLNKLIFSNSSGKKIIENDSVRKIIFNDTKRIFLENIDSVTKRVLLNSEIIKLFKPELIINSHDPSITGSSFVLPAKAMNTPSLLLTHGLFAGERYLPDFYSDYIAVWGTKQKQYINKLTSRNTKTVFNLGSPIFDDNDYKTVNSSSALQTNYPLKIGFFLTLYHPNELFQLKFFYELFTALTTVKKQIECHFRFHEGFPIKNLDKLALDFGLEIKDDTLQELSDFIQLNNLFITWDTTAILWVMRAGKPLIHTSPYWNKGIFMLPKKYKAAWIPNNAQELVNKIKEYITNPRIYEQILPGQKRFLEDYTGPLDGKSSKRLYEIIKKITENKLEND